MNLPKGTEHFISDIHGEYCSFSHILNNGSGIIKNKIEDIFSNQMTERERSALATLIYYPEEKLEIIKKEEKYLADWYTITLYRLIEVAREVSSKYTRSKVRKALPKGFDYIIDELLHLQGNTHDKDTYYSQIIKSIVELDRADEFIVAISNLIKRMTIDHLHVLGDIFDRGPSAKLIMDTLMKFHSLDIELGNHDILWMGAACGNKACIANVIRICSRYDNIDTLEEYNRRAEALIDYVAKYNAEYNRDIKYKTRFQMTELSTRYLADMQTSFSNLLNTLMDGAAPESVMDTSFKVKLREGGKTQHPESLSQGWRDAVQFCVRLSLAEALYAEGEAPPIILDDPFVNLDERRLEAAKRLLVALAKKYQILYLVCHAERR